MREEEQRFTEGWNADACCTCETKTAATTISNPKTALAFFPILFAQVVRRIQVSTPMVVVGGRGINSQPLGSRFLVLI
jgi:hypothetical protein